MADDNRQIHPSPYPNWNATQDVSCVWIYERGSDRRIKLEPPAEWGQHWAWNFTEDGKGICFKRTDLQRP